MKFRKLFKVSAYLLIALIAAVLTFFGILFLGGFGEIPSKKELANIQNENASLIYSEDGKLIGKFFASNRTNVPYDSLPEHLVHALIATEDARFYEHEGVDGRSVIRVLLKTLIMGDRSSGGGSTLSQQLTKNFYGRKSYGKISIYINKFKEIILAYRIENLFSKGEIIQFYLNTVPFGENVYGIESAAQRYFNTTTSKLKVEEAAVLIGMLKANTYYNPRLHPDHAKGRRQVVLSQMSKYGYISEEEKDSLQALDLQLNYSNILKNSPAPYFLVRLRKEAELILEKVNTDREEELDIERDGLIIQSSLNLELQQLAQASMRKHLQRMQVLLRLQYQQPDKALKLQELANKIAKQEALNLADDKAKKRMLFYWEKDAVIDEISLLDSLKHTLSQLQAGVLALDPKNGSIKTWVGGIDFQHYPYDQILAKRQLASTFKPILYAAALESGQNVCDYLSNEAIVLTDFEDWSPQNYDGESGGEYSLAAALAYSKNIPTLHLYLQTPWDSISDLWSRLGFVEELKEEPSAILGTASVNIFELAIAYSAFANGGKSISPYTIEQIKTAEGEVIYQHKSEKTSEILDREVSEQINEILIKAVREGTGTAIPNRFGIRSQWAGKTGTSQDFADAWFVCYNQKIIFVSRLGASYPSIHFNSGEYGSGSRLALPIIGEILKESKGLNWYNAGLKHSNEIQCEDYREVKGLKKFFKSFESKERTLEQAKDKAEKKKKRKSFFKKLFGGDE
ncbi:MAG: transglycosylase domain-containing protein [Vicingaceae bacterium]